ncbi:hypothetical protein [Paenibacillus luteus]|uniref:hypothetical protein n=1 Tax=Paenibacillus luteus TaxID=2545753 RepID=UPI0011420BD0|nr:hypothetical protein [Paenibacillus luteus]
MKVKITPVANEAMLLSTGAFAVRKICAGLLLLEKLHATNWLGMGPNVGLATVVFLMRTRSKKTGENITF